MKKIVFAAAAAASLIGTNDAAATDTRSLSEFLMACGRNERVCRLNLEDYVRAARDQGLICPPADLSLERAVNQELSWLRTQRDIDPALNDGNVEDAQWAAVNALWPCKKPE